MASIFYFYSFDRMKVSTQSNTMAFNIDESFFIIMIESIDPKITQNANELEEARFWLGQLGKMRNIYVEKLLKLTDNVDASSHEAKINNTVFEMEKSLVVVLMVSLTFY